MAREGIPAMVVETPRFFMLSPTGAAHQRLREAEQYFLLGNLNESLAAAQQAWREHHQEPDVYRVLAYLHMARGEFPPAVQAARQAMVIDGDNPMSYAMLAQVYLTFDIYKLAREVLTQARERFPADHSFTALLADLCFRQQQFTQGVELAEQVLERNPHDGYMKALLGQHSRKRKRYAVAARYLVDAVAMYPQRADYRRDLGVALSHLGRHAEGGRHLAESMALNPNDTVTKHYLFYALQNWQVPSWYWLTSRFFYEHRGLGLLCQLLGWAAILTGAVWLPINLATQQHDLTQVSLPAGILVIGLALAVLSASGLGMAARRGVRFDAYLHKRLELMQADRPADGR